MRACVRVRACACARVRACVRVCVRALQWKCVRTCVRTHVRRTLVRNMVDYRRSQFTHARVNVRTCAFHLGESGNHNCVALAWRSVCANWIQQRTLGFADLLVVALLLMLLLLRLGKVAQATAPMPHAARRAATIGLAAAANREQPANWLAQQYQQENCCNGWSDSQGPLVEPLRAGVVTMRWCVCAPKVTRAW